MELRHLRYFVAVAEERHFGRAAERLHMAQPPLSQQIRQLEGELGTRLFARTTRKVDLTPAGELLLARARQLLADVDRTVLDAQRAERGEIGRLAVGFTGSATYELLPSIARALSDELPDIELELHGEMLTPAQVEGLLSGTLDVALLRPPVHSLDLTTLIIRREPLVAVVPSEHRLANARGIELIELAEDSFITYPSHDRSVVHEAVENACRKAGFSAKVVQEVGETSTLVSFVAAGLGVALVPASVQHLHIDGAVYCPLVKTTEMVALAAVSRTDESNPVVHRFVDRVSSLLGRSLGAPNEPEIPGDEDLRRPNTA